MGRSRSRSVVGAGTALTAVTLAACGGVGGGGGGSDQAASSSGGKVTISTMGFGLPDEIATVRVKTYENSAKGGPVKITEGGFDEQQFLAAVASGNPPDAVHLDRAKVGTYAARGAIVPMDDCIAKSGIDMSQYRKPGVQQVTLDGKVYAIPEFYGMRLLISDDAVVKKAGLTTKQVASGDWDTITMVNDKMTQGSGRNLKVIGYDPRIPETLPLWAAANGGQMLSADGKTASLGDPKVVEALTFTTNLVKRAGKYSEFKATREGVDFFGKDNQYATDTVGAMPIDDFYLNVLADVSPKAGFTVSPILDRQGKQINYSGGSSWAIPKGAKHPEEACEFAKVMTAADTWVAAAKARAEALRAEGGYYLGTNTGNKVADERIRTEVFKPTGVPALDNGAKVLQQAQDSAVTLPATYAGSEFEKAYTDAVTRVLEGSQTPAQALKQAQGEAQKALDAAAKSRQ
ncbi:MAG TPA: extracellular solute-binding protein [Actinomycetales bacterium]|nr:extracellular solute-binding protein [Actinomycetales bacterium]